MSKSVDKKIQTLPTSPGVYMFKDARGNIIYVGKAKSLRARVRSHFAAVDVAPPHNVEVVRRTRDIDTIVVSSEAEALLLEANLIKSHQPRFNIRLKDDKKYPYIKVTVQEPFPRVFVTRLLAHDGAKYFGPYTDVAAMRLALEVVKRLYTVRSCRYDLPDEAPARPCLDYHIGRCLAPCVGLQSREQYRLMTEEILDVLAGNVDHVRKRVEDEMRDAAEKMEFERAANLRDVLAGLASIERRQRAIDIRGGDLDVVGTARDGDRGCAVLLRIRAGKLLGRELDFFENVSEESDATLLEAAATRFYFGRGEHGLSDLPREVLFPLEFEDRTTIEELLAEHSARKIATHVPQKGDKLRLIDLAQQNARHLLEERVVLEESARDRADDILYDVQEALELKVVPRVIVCFDISHFSGSEVVGSAVVFVNAESKKGEYRRFRIRGDWGNDDFRSMAEIVGRYFKRRIDEQLPIPDLAVIDGGKGQLGAAIAAATAIGAPDVTFIGLAKKDEEIYFAARPEPLRLARTSPALRLLQRVRNEAHRFAHSYNRKLRTKRTLTSELSEIPGIGPSRQKALLEKFGSLRAVKEANVEDLAKLPGFSEKLARRVLEHLEKMKALIFDPFAGISGDMTLGALIDLGLDAEWLRSFVRDLGLGDIEVIIERAQRRGIACGRVRFNLPPEHAHRHLRHVIEIIDRSNTTELTRQRARRAFQLLAEAEAKVHGTTVEKVHFHEVGALDAILDVLCVMAGVEKLGFEAFYTRPVALGHGWIEIAHGSFPVPAPATLDLLAGIPTTGTELAGECTTPTGAAIVATLTQGKKAPDVFTILKTGFGAGERDPADRPNCVRLIAAEIESAEAVLYVVHCDIDDLSAEYAAAAQQALLDAGALDTVIVNVAMKKGRPGIRIEALVAEARLDAILKALFASTTTIGARYWPVMRASLPRAEDTVEWRGQRIRRKQVTLPDGTVRWKPEYDDVLMAASSLGLPPLAVRQAVDKL